LIETGPYREIIVVGRVDARPVLRLPPGDGAATPFAVPPDLSMGLAATDERLYSLGVVNDRLWGRDRRRGDLVQTLPTGRHPLGVVGGGIERR
jgi:hypothetical protein